MIYSCRNITHIECIPLLLCVSTPLYPLDPFTCFRATRHLVLRQQRMRFYCLISGVTTDSALNPHDCRVNPVNVHPRE